MKLTVFGATGRIGKPFVEQALSVGHEITALVRDPSRVTIAHRLLTVVQGDAADPAAVECAICGADAVVSVMATSASQKVARTRPLTRATRNVIDAMKKKRVKRLIVSSCKTAPQPGDKPDIRFKVLKVIVKLLTPESWNDSVGFIHLVRASDLDWTIVRIGRGEDVPPTGYVETGYVDKATRMRTSRADAVAFMLDELLKSKHLRQAPVIFSR